MDNNVASNTKFCYPWSEFYTFSCRRINPLISVQLWINSYQAGWCRKKKKKKRKNTGRTIVYNSSLSPTQMFSSMVAADFRAWIPLNIQDNEWKHSRKQGISVSGLDLSCLSLSLLSQTVSEILFGQGSSPPACDTLPFAEFNSRALNKLISPLPFF